MPAQALEQYRIREPEWATTYGQGAHPTGPSITLDGATHVLGAWGEVVQCTATATTTPGIGNLTASPKKILAEVIDQFGIYGEQDGGIFEHLPQE